MSNRFHNNPPLRYGMIGGGITSQIGDSHRAALRRDSCFQLVAGAFDIDDERGQKYGKSLGLEPDRIYPDYQKMVQSESEREDGIQVAGIMTPNSTHYEIAKYFIKAGIHLILEKPITTKTAEALDLMRLAKEKNVLCASMYAYCGYPMIQRKFHGAQNNWLEDAESKQLLGKFAKPDEVAELVALILSDRGGVMCGSLIDYDQEIVGTSD